MGLYGNVRILVGTNFHRKAELIASIPYMIGRIDEELRIPVLGWIGNGMYLDAT